MLQASVIVTYDMLLLFPHLFIILFPPHVPRELLPSKYTYPPIIHLPSFILFWNAKERIWTFDLHFYLAFNVFCVYAWSNAEKIKLFVMEIEWKSFQGRNNIQAVIHLLQCAYTHVDIRGYREIDVRICCDAWYMADKSEFYS